MSTLQKIIASLLAISVTVSNGLVVYSQSNAEQSAYQTPLSPVTQTTGSEVVQESIEPDSLQAEVAVTETENGKNLMNSSSANGLNAAPAAFSKTAPANSAANVATQVTLQWQAASGAVGYGYCIDTVIDATCGQGVDNFTRVTGTSVILSLEPGKKYEWQARAYAADGTWTPGNGSGAWWTFTTNPTDTGPFGKVNPANGASGLLLAVTLSWQSSVNAVRYGYCIDTTTDNTCDAGVDNFTSVNGTSVSLTLQPNTVYQWQARAYSSNGDWTPANGSGAWWTFTTGSGAPGAFSKLGPANGVFIASSSVTLSWNPSSGAVRYGYCIDTTLDNTCDRGVDNFISVTGTSINLSLAVNTTYQWQVRAYSSTGQWTPADGSGTWWGFVTNLGGPAPFSKVAPANNQQNVATTLVLSWQPTTGAVGYGYCLDANLDNYCDQGVDNFVRVSGTSAIVSLDPGKTYRWQARAYASNGGWTAADGTGNWWQFNTTPNGTSSFGKVSPSNGATNVATAVRLSWQGSANAVKYGYCIDTTLDNICDAGVDNFTFVQDTSVVVNLTANKSYQWQARSYAADGSWTPANGSGQWWSFSTAGSLVSGYTPGEFGVSEAGAANYRISFVVPPGTGGMSPQIALTYDSRGSNTIAGWGWSLTGLSLISRCPTTVAQHGFTDGVDFDGNDQFCMDGQLLVAVNGVYGADGTVYRTENESFTKVVSTGKSGNGPLAFKAWTKAGLIIEYGSSVNSRLEASGRSDVLYWAVTKISDTKGNYMSFTYDKYSTTGELLPKWIDYTGNSAQNLAPYDRVEFLYELRPDGRVQFIAGTPVRLSKRIQYLRVYADGVLMREFRFGYEVSPTTGRSRLVNLTECGMGGQCLLSSRFSWSSQSTDELNFNGSGTGSWTGHAGGQNNNFIGDYNGDGKTDMAGYTGANGQWHVCFSTGSSFTCSYLTAHARGSSNTFTGDFNGDGRTDLAGFTGSGGQWEICLSQGNAFQCSLWQGHSGLMNNNIVTDFNGDGRTDIAGFSGNSMWHVCLSTGSNFTCSMLSAHNGGNFNNVTADFNGDGMADLAGYTGANGQWHVCRFTGSAFECSYWTGHGGGVSNNVTGDFNGDGLADMAGYMGSNNQWHVCFSTGVNFECSVWTAHGGGSTNNVSGDFNGDGLTDMAGYMGSNNQWHVCLSTGAGFTCGNRTWTGHGGGSSNNFSGDYNGDGKTDLAGYAGNGVWHVTTANDPYPDQLLQFINGHSATVNVTYAPLTNSTIYTKSTGAVYPQRDFQAPLYVVASYTISNGIGGQRKVSYAYQGLRINQQGRGFLGFASIRAMDSETGIKTVTQYLQSHPYKSLPAKVEQFQANGKLIQSVENSWSVLNFTAAVQVASMSESEARTHYALTDEETQKAVETTIAEGASALSVDDLVAGEVSPDATDLAQRVFLPLVSSNGSAGTGETPLNPPDSAALDYDFTHFIDSGELPLPENAEIPVADVTFADNPNSPMELMAVEVDASALEAVAAPNAQGVTYFPYVSQSLVKKFEVDGTLTFSTTTSTLYDSYGNPTSITESSSDGYVKTTSNTYTNDSTLWILGRLTLAKATAQAPNQAAQTRTSAFSYDATTGLLIREETEPNSTLSLVKSYEYDGFGNIIRSTTSGPDITTRSQSSQFGVRGRFMIQSSNALGQASQIIHDQTLGVPVMITDVNGLVTNRKYDGFGRMVEETRPEGSKTSVAYVLCSGTVCPANAVYYVRTEVSGTAPSLVYFDMLDRQVRSEAVAFNLQATYVDTVYNAKGQVQQRSEPYFNGVAPIWTTYSYDALGRTVLETRPNGARTTTEYKGFTVRMVNALNQASSRVVNSQGWLMSSTDALNGIVRYSYDSFGDLLTLVDPAGNTTTMQYDLRGRKVSMRDPDSGLVTYRYDVLNELIGQTDAKNQTVSLSYDLLGRMIQRTEPEGISTWVYDTSAKGIGRLAGVNGINGYKESYSYDSLSRLAKTTYTADGQSYVFENTYDAYSRISKITYPGGFRIRNKYTDQGYFKEVRNDADGSLFWRADTMNVRGQLEKAAFGNNLYTNQQFDAQTGFLKTIQTGSATTPTQVQNLSFAFDALGNLSSRSDVNQALTEVFSYDSLNRMVKAQVNTRTADTVQYDALGNITFKSDVGSYSYGGNGVGPHAVTAISGGISANFTYDANGNRISSNGGSIAYTSFNLPTTLVQGNNRITYAYGPDHERYKRTVQANGVTTTTLMIDALYEKESTGTLTTQNYYIPAAGRMVAMQIVRSNGITSTQYLHRDHLGSISAITGATGNVIERQNYDAWGKRRTSDWRSTSAAITSVVRRGYTGHEQLDEVGLIHMNGRVYDPTIGRFLSPDPFVQAPGYSQSLNRYTYVLNNPLSLTDPSGFNWFSDAWKGVKDFFEKNWKPIVAGAVTLATAGWASGVLGLGLVSSSMLGGFVGGVTQVRLYGGDWIKAIRNGFIEGLSAYFNPFSTQGMLKALTGGMEKLTTNFAGSLWSITKYATGSYVNALATNYVIKPISQALGLPINVFNLMLSGVSQLGNVLAGDRINDNMENKSFFTQLFGIGNRKNSQIGFASYFFDAVDVGLSYQGLLTATSRQYFLDNGINAKPSGHSEAAADVANLARRGLANGGSAYALPFLLIAPANVSVTIGTGDWVNGGILGKLTNPDALLVPVEFGYHSQGCYSDGKCTAIWEGWFTK